MMKSFVIAVASFGGFLACSVHAFSPLLPSDSFDTLTRDFSLEDSPPCASLLRASLSGGATKNVGAIRELKRYCEGARQVERFRSRSMQVGPHLQIGSRHPIAVQTMTTSDTKDVQKSVEQVMKIADMGADLVRLTVQGMAEARAAAKIREELFKRNYNIPLVADIHFAPKVAMAVADAFEKIRVNPGNFADGAKSFENQVFETVEDFNKGREKIEELLTPLIEKCKQLKRAMRIGTNHGSLSARVMSFHGDSPRGMVESALEFADIARKNDFHNFCFSMKASNPIVMAQAYRLLVAEQIDRGLDYPIHLGVTEAGEGEDGRIKSAIGIGAMLQDGIGDTIRVSLTEDPWYELSPCRKLASIGMSKSSDDVERARQEKVPLYEETARDFQNFKRREVQLPYQKESDDWDVRGILHRDGSVISSVSWDALDDEATLYSSLGCKTVLGMPYKDLATVDSIYLARVPPLEDRQKRRVLGRLLDAHMGVLAPYDELQRHPLQHAIAVISLDDIVNFNKQENLPEGAIRYAVRMRGDEDEFAFSRLAELQKSGNAPVMALVSTPSDMSRLHATRRLYEMFVRNALHIPMIHHLALDHTVSERQPALLSSNMQETPTALSRESKEENLVIHSGVEIGGLLVDAIGEGVFIEDESSTLSPEQLKTLSFTLLQGARMRNTKTEFISCPSCGRTLFDIQATTNEIRKRTGHLAGVSIAVMGCIVNGPGEMADADFGYVGGAPGKVDLYVGKKVVKRGIPNAEACDALIELIKEHGRWKDPPSDDEDGAAAGQGDISLHNQGNDEKLKNAIPA